MAPGESCRSVQTINTDFIYEVIKSKAHILMPSNYSKANNSPAVVIIVPLVIDTQLPRDLPQTGAAQPVNYASVLLLSWLSKQPLLNIESVN